MAVKILTGILVPQKQNGTARIHFNPHRITGEARGVELERSGSSGDYISRPGKVVSLRQFQVKDKHTFWEASAGEWFRINDHNWTETHIDVSWSCKAGCSIEEISYLLTGEVAVETSVYNPTATTCVIAASDSINPTRADYLCDGEDDQVELQRAVDSLSGVGGKIVLLEGTYSWFDKRSKKLQLKNNIQIQGCGRATNLSINNNITAFQFRKHSGVVIKDLQITLSPLSPEKIHDEAVIEFVAKAFGEQTQYNKIENIFITCEEGQDDTDIPEAIEEGLKDDEKPEAGNYTGIKLSASNRGTSTSTVNPFVSKNTIRDVVMRNVNRGIVLETDGIIPPTNKGDRPWVGNNTFDNIFMYKYVTGVEFVEHSNYVNGANHNRFIAVRMQTAPYSKDGFKNIRRKWNTFTDCLVYDWHKRSSDIDLKNPYKKPPAPSYAWSIHKDARFTFIQTPQLWNNFQDNGKETIILERGRAYFGGKLQISHQGLIVDEGPIQLSGQRMISSSATPVSRSEHWNKGDIVWNSDPSPGGNIGWICTESGTPGTWRAFGNIDMDP